MWFVKPNPPMSLHKHSPLPYTHGLPTPEAALLPTYSSMPCCPWHRVPSCSSAFGWGPARRGLPAAAAGTDTPSGSSGVGVGKLQLQSGRVQPQARLRCPPAPERASASSSPVCGRGRAGRCGQRWRRWWRRCRGARPCPWQPAAAGGGGEVSAAGLAASLAVPPAAARARSAPGRGSGVGAEGPGQRGWCCPGSAVRGPLNPCRDGQRSWADGATGDERAGKGRARLPVSYTRRWEESQQATAGGNNYFAVNARTK